jgi:integrase
MYNEMRPVKPQSLIARDSAFKKFTQYGLSEIQFSKVTTLQLERFQKWLHNRLSSQTAFNYITHIVAMFNWAYKKRIIAINPAGPLDIITPEKKEAVIFSKEEFFNRLDLYKEKYFCLYGPALLAGFFGLRAGEICAINIDGDFDFERKVLCVTRQYGYINKDGKADFKEPKSKTSVREIPIFPFVEPIIKEHIERVKDVYSKAYTNIPNAKEIPFCPSSRKSRYVPQKLAAHWKEVAIQEGLATLSLHKLRHTYATICRDAEISMETIADILGHADVKITRQIYAHKTFKQITTASEKLNNIFQR